MRWLALLLLCGPLIGCDPFSRPESLMDDYLERVGRVLEIDAAASPLPEVIQLPSRRELVREPPQLDMSILEFLSLYGCELQQVVGEKNSVLGKVMQPAQQLQYEIRFIQAAHECLPTIDDESLRVSLANALTTKRKALPLVVWNATWAAPEMQQLFTRSDGYLPLAPDADDLASLTADLGRLNTWLRNLAVQDRPAMVDNLSQIHQHWQSLATAGELVQGARLLIARLGDVEKILAARLQGRPLCFNQKPNRDAEIMRNLFFNIYAGKVQPYMAEIQRVRARLVPMLRELAGLQESAMPVAFRPFQDAILEEGAGTLWGRLDQAVRRHTERWQHLLDQCGMRPKA